MTFAFPFPASTQRLSQAVLKAAAAIGLAIGVQHACAAGNAAEWPSSPITFIVPFNAGGGGDTMGRLYGQELAKAMGATVVVDNKPGAGGNIGTAAAARANPDGNTIVFGTNGTMGTNLALYKKPGYTVSDFEPVAMFGVTSLVLVVNKDSPYNSIADVVADAKQHPRQLMCANAGNGTASHLACTLLMQMTGVEMEHLPLRGGSSAIVELRAGRIPFLIDVTPYLVPQISSGAIRALGVTMGKRAPSMPQVPTFSESGVPGFELVAWDGIFAPKGTPADRLDKLHAGVEKAVNDPVFKKSMLDRGTQLTPMPRKEFADYVRRESVRMGEIARHAGISLD